MLVQVPELCQALSKIEEISAAVGAKEASKIAITTAMAMGLSDEKKAALNLALSIAARLELTGADIDAAKAELEKVSATLEIKHLLDDARESGNKDQLKHAIDKAGAAGFDTKEDSFIKAQACLDNVDKIAGVLDELDKAVTANDKEAIEARLPPPKIAI